MKTRNGFVSNSSSSSFIVWGFSDKYYIPNILKTQKDQTKIKVPFTFGGEVSFARQRDNYKDFGSKLNWAYLQWKYVEEANNYLKDKDITNLSGDDKYWFTPERIEFLKKHENDIKLLESVLLENFYIKTIDWCFTLEDIDFFSPNEKPLCEGYIDHQSRWRDRPDVYEEIFLNKGTIYEWLFTPDNYIACRSDEYGDAGDLEVNHRLDYEIYDDFYNEYNNPEMFENGRLKVVS